MERIEESRAEERDDLSDAARRVLPYSAIVGQDEVKRALEVAYVAPRLGGVLLSGERGTGKSTAVRAFSLMIHDRRLPVTLPINATEDRVVGGWDVSAALRGDKEWREGLLYEAGKDGRNRILYIDEVNLLDDHLVNILLDVTATGILEIQREGHKGRHPLTFTLVGTMNPEEGGLRPQLLDRFGVMAQVRTEEEHRAAILRSVLDFDRAVAQSERGEPSDFLEQMAAADTERQKRLDKARKDLLKVELPDEILDRCVELASAVKTDGHRGERVLALAAQAHAAIEGDAKVEPRHLRTVAAMALQHRQKGMAERSGAFWGPPQEDKLDEVFGK